MNTIMNTHLVAQRLGRWDPGDLAFIDALDYRCSVDDEPAQVRLATRFQRRDTAKHGWPNGSAPFVRVILLFRGVADLQLKGFGRTPKQITGFDIRDVSDRGLEGIRFLIEDYENGQISLECSEAAIETVS